MSQPIPWKVSLHGGHSGQFCNHAKGTLREMIEAALDQRMSIFGMTEHSPRYEDRHLFDEEKSEGWDADVLVTVFESYSFEARKLQEEYGRRIELLRGFETEFIDDSHSPDSVGVGIESGRDYLLSRGVESITTLTKVDGETKKIIVSLNQ